MTLDAAGPFTSKLEIGKLYKLIKPNHPQLYNESPNTFKLAICKDVKSPIQERAYESDWRYNSLITNELTYYDNSVLYFNDIVVLLDIKTFIDTKYTNRSHNSEFKTIGAEIHKILYGEDSVYRNYCIISAGSKIYYCPENEFECCFEKLDQD